MIDIFIALLCMWVLTCHHFLSLYAIFPSKFCPILTKDFHCLNSDNLRKRNPSLFEVRGFWWLIKYNRLSKWSEKDNILWYCCYSFKLLISISFSFTTSTHHTTPQHKFLFPVPFLIFLFVYKECKIALEYLDCKITVLYP